MRHYHTSDSNDKRISRLERLDQANSSSPMNQLLPDCKDHLFRFLTIQDSLVFSATSKSSLRDVLPNLRQRRQDQFLTNYSYQIEYPSVLRPVEHTEQLPETSMSTDNSDHHNETVYCSTLVDRDHWHTIPSILERVISLYRTMPKSHPSTNDLRELMSDLKQGNHQAIPTDTTESTKSAGFSSYFEQLQLYTKAHKIHASILAKCTVYLKPSPCDRYSSMGTGTGNPASEDPTKLSVALEAYVGDVLCACYLMGHQVSGIIEGGVSQLQWSRHVLSLMERETQNNALSWYEYWVYLHSTLLRTFPLSPNQMKILLGSVSGIRGFSVPHNMDYVHPHYCYVGMEPHLVKETTKVVRTLLLHLGNNTANDDPTVSTRMAHQTTMNRFGPLGPAFRGRDDIRTRIMNPFSLLHRLHHPSYVIPTTWFLVEQKEHMIIDSRTFHSWFSGTDTVMAWMLELKEECEKSRPMTVTPPIVTIEPLPLHTFMSDNAIH